MILLLEEWYRQLCDGLEEAKAAFPDPEPERRRVWTVMFPSGPIRLRMPTADDPADEWEWISVPCTPPLLVSLEKAIDRIGQQILSLRGDTNA